MPLCKDSKDVIKPDLALSVSVPLYLSLSVSLSLCLCLCLSLHFPFAWLYSQTVSPLRFHFWVIFPFWVIFFMIRKKPFLIPSPITTSIHSSGWTYHALPVTLGPKCSVILTRFTSKAPWHLMNLVFAYLPLPCHTPHFPLFSSYKLLSGKGYFPLSLAPGTEVGTY